VYLGTHCNIGEDSFPLAYSMGDTTVYVQCPHRFVYSDVMTQQNVDGSDRRNFLLLCTYSARNVRPSPKMIYERHIFEMSASPRNDSHCLKLYCLSCTRMTNTFLKVPKLPIFSCFGDLWNPCTEILKFFNGLCMHTPIHVFYFKNAQNLCRISGWKSALYWWQTKTRFCIFRWNPWGDFP